MSWQTTKARCDTVDTRRLGKLFHKGNLVKTVLTFHDSVSNLSTPACESGKQLPAYKTSKRGNPRAQPSYNNWSNNRGPRAIPQMGKSPFARKTTGCRATTNPYCEKHVLFAARQCARKISCHLSTVVARLLSVLTDYKGISGTSFQNKPRTRDNMRVTRSSKAGTLSLKTNSGINRAN